ncbi:M90 family metallopeptidase [Bremerella alba]|uniref:Protein MtfA n=1 Tax=Bremerella alba TaxID=980252 RepID=A0A7V8V2K0_9BACT|nr:M90 family metallopeptidase [Bremerella alba]MBA2113716.1 Protein MtfA [Bremerella alba]
MLFSWFKSRSRRRIKEAAFPEPWRQILVDNLWQYARLTSDEKTSLHQSMAVLLQEKNWEGCNGFHVDEETKVLVAAQVGLLTLGLEDEYFDNVLSILIYPTAYRATSQSSPGAGIIIEGQSDRLGEAWYRGPVILTHPDIVDGAQSTHGGRNLVMHEFAHQIDMLNGRVADGIPPIDSHEEVERWNHCFEHTYQQLVEDCQRGRSALVDCYGATNKAECFAVLSETFFQQPQRIAQNDPDMFQALCGYYRQDPQRWQN